MTLHTLARIAILGGLAASWGAHAATGSLLGAAIALWLGSNLAAGACILACVALDYRQAARARQRPLQGQEWRAVLGAPPVLTRPTSLPPAQRYPQGVDNPE